MTAASPAQKPWQRLPKRLLVADGLLLAAHLVWPHGPLSQLWSAPFVLAGLALVAALQLRTELLERIPWPFVRDNPTTWALLLLLAAGVIGAEPSLGAVLHFAGLLLLWRETRTSEVDEHVDPVLAWRAGWVSRGVVVAFGLCLVTLGLEWTGAFSTSYTTSVGDWTYYNSYATSSSSGWETGEAPFLGLLLVGVALWAVSPPVRTHRSGRWLPVAAFAGAAARAAIVAWEDWRYVEELHDIGGGYPQVQAAGPVYFLIVAVAGALLSLLHSRRAGRGGATGVAAAPTTST